MINALACEARKRRSSGLSLVELSIAMLVATAIGGAGVLLMDTSQKSSASILAQTRTIAELRKAGELVSMDVQQASVPNLTIVQLTDRNHSVTVRKPVAVTAGVITWGVQENDLGTDTASRTRQGWSVRYTVKGTGADRQLVRQILDDAGKVQKERTLLRGLRAGSGTSPGFKITAAGTMWKLELGIDEVGGNPPTAGSHAVSFDISLRN